MLHQRIFREGKFEKKVFVLALVVALASANVAIDFAYSQFHGTGFCFSESSLFSTFWLLFAVSIPMFAGLTLKIKNRLWLPLVVLIAASLHVLSYPALVWLISRLFCAHTFNYGQTFRYALTMYPVYAMLIYGLAAALVIVSKRNASHEGISPKYLTHLQVPGRHNSQVVLDVTEIVHVSASPPYVQIFHRSGVYLLSGTLKTMQEQLDPSTFVRVHKSHILNLNHVMSLQSRSNGDYDITISDGAKIRLSRMYAKMFKAALAASHRLTA